MRVVMEAVLRLGYAVHMGKANKPLNSLLKRAVGILVLGSLVVGGIQLGRGLGDELSVVLLNDSGAAISDIGLRWMEGRVWWARLKPGEMREARLRVSEPSGLELSYLDSFGLPRNFEKDAVLKPDGSWKIQLRIQKDGSVVLNSRISSASFP